MSRSALVWGASGGIGRALVKRLASDGWTVVAASRHPGDVSDLTELTVEADTADSFGVQRAMVEAVQLAGDIGLWIYAAGDVAVERTAEQAPDVWRRIMDANLTGAYLTAHHSLPYLADDAHLIFVGAVSERLRLPGFGAYAAAKAGLEAYATVLSKEERGRRITVVRPGAVDTPFWDKVPMRLPSGAMSADDVAERIMAAYSEGSTGLLDL